MNSLKIILPAALLLASGAALGAEEKTITVMGPGGVRLKSYSCIAAGGCSEQQGRGSLGPVMSLEQAQQRAREAIEDRERKARQPPVHTKQWWEDYPALNLAVNGGTAFKTRRGSMLCLLPSSLKEAEAASGDRAWLKQIGCIEMDEATPVRVVDKIGDLLNGLWQVRLPEKGTTLWASWRAFDPPF